MLKGNQALAPAALVHALVLICGVTHTRAVGNAVVSTTLTLGDLGYRSKLLSAEQTVGAGVADILRAVPIAIVDFTNVAKGDGDAEIVVEASMIIGTPQVMSSEEAKTSIMQHLAEKPLSESVATLNANLERAFGAPEGTADYVLSIGDTSVTAKPYGDDAKDNGWGLGGAVIQGMVTLGDTEYRTKLLAENREATNIAFHRYHWYSWGHDL
ncbi:hypothetical protein DUNSADRAFT_12988 [Dunaliella salina]|uniref:Uncharacterized protein n=1 Tax=Dunaliella salina TaxID=3046 RepID=A0ABQ7GAA7_DUNSA|nr:hypothetical protein DUNSADRAFT_12988 [Dunaliella salina]|eukprot:KAF5831542.1 hypothetical protein DUNSADRAFT_12988 [Dunaliella salina]